MKIPYVTFSPRRAGTLLQGRKLHYLSRVTEYPTPQIRGPGQLFNASSLQRTSRTTHELAPDV